MAGKSLYSAAAQEVFDLFDDYIEGVFDRPFLVVCSQTPGDAATTAIEKSLTVLGFTAPAYSLVQLNPTAATCALDDQAALLLIEGIDPLHVICTDAGTTDVLSKAYRTKLELNAVVRLWGRTGVAFENLDTLINTETGKRTAWELFKALR